MPIRTMHDDSVLAGMPSFKRKTLTLKITRKSLAWLGHFDNGISHNFNFYLFLQNSKQAIVEQKICTKLLITFLSCS